MDIFLNSSKVFSGRGLSHRSIRRGLVCVISAGLLSVSGGMFPSAVCAKDLPSDPESLVGDLFSDVRRVLSEDSDDRSQMDSIHQIAHRYFEVDAISAFVLGPYARMAKSDGMLDLFRDIFTRVQIWRVVGRLRGATSDFSYRILETTEQRRNIVLVRTLVTPTGSDAFPLDWRILVRQSGNPKVIDMIVQGSSIMVQLRQEYTSWLRSNDGDVVGLTQRIQQPLPKGLREPVNP